VHDSKEYNYTYACIEEFYIPLETPKIENEGGDAIMDFGDVKMEHVNFFLEFIKTPIERITMKT
jgi:hypothetical protein